MSAQPFGDPAGQYAVPWFAFDYLEHVVPFGAQRVNYRECSLCHGEYLPDSSGSEICGRELCKAFKIALALAAEAEREQARIAVA